MREIRVGLAGLGQVGSAAARLLVEDRERLSHRLGGRLTLHAVCGRGAAARARRLGLPRSVRVVRGWRELASDRSIEVIVELFGGVGDARRLVLESLRRGKDVVTANKALLSRRWREVHGTAHREGRRVGFEAAVAGAIPVLGPLTDCLHANRILGITGILNGTTNFVLSRMAEDGLPLGEALVRARRLGLAEADARLDLDGTDSAHKLSILASLALGRWLPPSAVSREGIQRLSPEDLRLALDECGRTVRLLGECRLGETVSASVRPVLVPLDHPLAAVRDAENAVRLETSHARDLEWVGLGAGPEPAASAVVGDVLAAARGILGGRSYVNLLWGAPGSPRTARPGEASGRFFLRFRAQDRPGVLGRIAAELGRAGVSIAHVVQRGRGSRSVPVVLLTHEAKETSVRRAMRRVASLSTVSRDATLLKLL